MKGITINRDGETNTNRFGEQMKIINYQGRRKFDVLFDNGYVKRNCTCYENFKKGVVKNPNSISLFGVGYLGVECSKGKGDIMSDSVSYITWRHMLSRCYDKKTKSYENYGGQGVSVCEEWMSYKIFKEWFDKNYYEISNDKMNLDKDILNKGNKIYSPNNCIFVPSNINKLFTKTNKTRGNYPIGVYCNKELKRYVAQCSKIQSNGKKYQTYLGSFDTPKEAFIAYKIYKENYIKEIADKYKYEIPQELYDALYRYEVEESD